jgi:cobalt/nickel transport system permease protein
MLWAVHISDGVLSTPWLAGGFALAAILLWLGAWRIRDEEIPRVAILTAAFFVSSLIHIRVYPTSIHLLMVGLVGVLLGRRAVLAIFAGLILQAWLLQHGGFYVLGVNTCVMTAPALLSWGLFQAMHRVRCLRTPIGQGALVGFGAIVWFLSAVYSVTLICNTSLTSFEYGAMDVANARLLDPWILGGALLFAAAAIVLERRLENTPEFPLGFLIGELSVLLTAALTCVVLLAGGETHWPTPPLVLVIAHLPFAVVEGVILGFAVGFLARVKPEMLGTTFSRSVSAEKSRRTPHPTAQAPS